MSEETASTTLSHTGTPHGIGWLRIGPHVAAAPGDPVDALAVEIEAREAPRGRLVRAAVRNTADRPVGLAAIRWASPYGHPPAVRFPASLAPRVFHTENLRGDFVAGGTTRGDGYFRSWPQNVTEYGRSEDHVFPGLFAFAAHEPAGLLCAAASARAFRPLFRLRGGDGAERLGFAVEEIPAGRATIPLAPGASIAGEWLFFDVVATREPASAVAGYERALARLGTAPGRSSNPLPAQRIYCSWNYDLFESVDESAFLAQAGIVARHLPEVGFLQLDDGYQRAGDDGRRTMVDLVYECDEGFDLAKFPSGGRGLADRVRAAGLRPAIWIGLWAPRGGRMIGDHPEWMLRDAFGEPLIFGPPDRPERQKVVLDPSLDDVRAYLERMLSIVFGEWGYEGVKLDFSSFAFEHKEARLAHPSRDALACRRWLVDAFRRHLPEDGFFGWCVVTGTADPLLGGEGADYFRCAEDIGPGDRDTVRRIAAWCANTQMLMPNRPILPNIDSIGVSRHLDARAHRSWLNLAAVMGGALEVSGDLRKLRDEQLAELAQTLRLSEPARRVWCPRIDETPPAVWVADGPSDRLLGLFNFADAERHLAAPPELFAPGARVRDAWTGEALEADALPRGRRFPPFGSLLVRLDHEAGADDPPGHSASTPSATG